MRQPKQVSQANGDRPQPPSRSVPSSLSLSLDPGQNDWLSRRPARLDDEWRRWIAENLALELPRESIIDSMIAARNLT